MFFRVFRFQIFKNFVEIQRWERRGENDLEANKYDLQENK